MWYGNLCSLVYSLLCKISLTSLRLIFNLSQGKSVELWCGPTCQFFLLWTEPLVSSLRSLSKPTGQRFSPSCFLKAVLLYFTFKSLTPSLWVNFSAVSLQRRFLCYFWQESNGSGAACELTFFLNCFCAFVEISWASLQVCFWILSSAYWCMHHPRALTFQLLLESPWIKRNHFTSLCQTISVILLYLPFHIHYAITSFYQ